jgi:hypothetical protein
MAIRGERGMFALSSDWLLRMRYNPFYAYLETTALNWAKNHSADAIPANAVAPAGTNP